MDELLTPVRTTYLRREAESDDQRKAATTAAAAEDATETRGIDSADDALSVLKSQPDHDSLAAALRFLTSNEHSSTFDIHAPSPESAAIVHVLVAEIATNYCALLQETSSTEDAATVGAADPTSDAGRLLQCLQSVTGVNAIVGHVKALLVLDKTTGGQDTKRPGVRLRLGIFLHLLATLLQGDDAIRRLWRASTACLADVASKRVQTHSLLSLVASGKMLSLAAEASALIGQDAVPDHARWLTEGVEFSRWIARNVVSWAKLCSGHGLELDPCLDLFQRSLSLGHADTIVTLCIEELLLAQAVERHLFSKVCLHHAPVAKKVINIVLAHLSRTFLNPLELNDTTPNETASAVAGVIDDVVKDDQARVAHLVGWCCSTSGAGLGDSNGIRRAVIAVLARDKETITSVLEKSLSQFGDQLYIKHTAIMQQQVHTEILLLAAGYVARQFPLKLTMLLRSGTYLGAISNRIASTNSRARFLGMCVGEALSMLQDPSAKRLDFHVEEMDSDEAQWFKGLAKVTDSVGPVEPILVSRPQRSRVTPTPRPTSQSPSRPRPKPKMPVSQPPPPRPIVEEVESSDESPDHHLQPMPDKGSDPEDSDDDATLVRRNKPKPPVYIRDLITFLRDSESYDRQELGIRTAPLLIRRKANFGTEVSSHTEELARLLIGLQDKFDLDDFENLRLQSIISLVVAQPKSMAPWFARTFFEGDYSLSQRTAVLVTLGLSARELAGMETSEYQASSSLASKRLPANMEQLYLEKGHDPSSPCQLKGLAPNALAKITTSLTSSFLEPLAAQAADAATGPDALKLQTFSARYKGASGKPRPRPRVRAIPNTTAALLSTSFFGPLTAHFQFALRSSRPVVLNPAVLALYLQTLAVIVHAAGPSTLALPQMTSELWDLLLRVRTHVAGDTAATRAWLVALSVLLEVNGEGAMRRVCEEHGREVLESREWVTGVFERTRGEDGGEENDVRMLAAGVLITLGEVVGRYQGLLVGDLVGFGFGG